MKWYHLVACFFMGVFLVNSLPHFIHGISGDFFPTPFANPPGKGLSSPLVNVMWGLINMALCLVMYHVSRISTTNQWTLLLFAVGFVAMSIRLSFALAHKGAA